MAIVRAVRRRAAVIQCAILALGVLALLMPAPASAEPLALVAEIEGAIGPAASRFVEIVIDTAGSRQAQMVVLRMDTPGGLSDSMREIIKTILASPVPVATFVAPSGARAASAGTYILYASHIAAMAPGTNLGAATPIRIGGGLPLPGRGTPTAPGKGTPTAPGKGTPTAPGKGTPTAPGKDTPEAPADGGASAPQPQGTPAPSDDALQNKIINDAVAYIRGLAELRGRNAQWAETAVREAASLPAKEALQAGVIDMVVNDVAQLLAAADGREVDLGGNPVTINSADLAVEQVQPSWQIQLLNIITNPNLAFILMMIGFYGLIFEFSNPGSIGPGVVGVICLLLGLYALNMLPLDLTGLALLLLGVALMTAEAFTPTFGVMGIGGLIAFVLGASLLVDSDSPHFRLSWEIIVGTALSSAVLLILVLGYALSAQRRPVTTGAAELLDEPAKVLEWNDDSGYVQVRGERWRARGEHDLAAGMHVMVTAIDGLVLDVSRTRPHPAEENGKGESA